MFKKHQDSSKIDLNAKSLYEFYKKGGNLNILSNIYTKAEKFNKLEDKDDSLYYQAFSNLYKAHKFKKDINEDDFEKLINKEIEKIKKIFQDSIKTNIELAKEFDGLKKRIKTVEIKLNGVLSVKKDAPVLAGKNNIKRMDFLSKKDYINSFGFYYAGYSEDGNVPTGYISDSTGKIYEVKIGDVINDRYKVSEIKPLYLKLKDIINRKKYIVSYKQ